jgi:hypothetical protein
METAGESIGDYRVQVTGYRELGAGSWELGAGSD